MLPRPSLPDGWVERLWHAMRANYGASFDRQWETPAGSDPAEHVRTLKAYWAQELGGYLHKPDALRHGLDNLPSFPPSLVEFKAICNRAPIAMQPALPAPKADPERVAAALARLADKPRQMTPAQVCIANIEVSAERALLTASQRHVLAACKAVLAGAEAA